ncbi:hypothetical protein SCLCIDRAFT_22662 [Scleroderma citrinum Foug A]|uniref:Uncharacterized protein n=1 Tax=Scleroderma citrinum Foug A TaxID=1036808 RepID=A0A0C3AKH8_9AGAM|nr:hypothetical protein SCLCIDRAFT_22662 [Scleroderma citrinum Foug A]
MSFYHPLDGYQLGPGHTLSAVPHHVEYGNDHGTDVIEDLLIDKNSSSDDEWFAEAIIQGSHPPKLNYSCCLSRTQDQADPNNDITEGMFIDENSPSDDEQFAEAIIQGSLPPQPSCSQDPSHT